jgi:hypothetical protein
LIGVNKEVNDFPLAFIAPFITPDNRYRHIVSD